MRTVITHFYNEAYLLPWWLKHHTKLFDHGVLIDHGSTDESADIIRTLAPHWRLVRSRLVHFDAFLTDLEVMNYEQELPGWKIALNVTEFLMPAMPLKALEAELTAKGRIGCASSGIVCVDMDPKTQPDMRFPLPLQKPWGIDESNFVDPDFRQRTGLTLVPGRSRFYHSNAAGLYKPGRHSSYHPDASTRLVDLMVFYFGYSPWNEHTLRRKLQVAQKLSPETFRHGYGRHHSSPISFHHDLYVKMLPMVSDLRKHEYARQALEYCAKYSAEG